MPGCSDGDGQQGAAEARGLVVQDSLHQLLLPFKPFSLILVSAYPVLFLLSLSHWPLLPAPPSPHLSALQCPFSFLQPPLLPLLRLGQLSLSFSLLPPYPPPPLSPSSSPDRIPLVQVPACSVPSAVDRAMAEHWPLSGLMSTLLLPSRLALLCPCWATVFSAVFTAGSHPRCLPDPSASVASAY